MRTAIEHPRLAKDTLKLTPEMRDLLRRRTFPFLDSVGIERPLPFLLEEAYLQGVRDTVEAMTHKGVI